MKGIARLMTLTVIGCAIAAAPSAEAMGTDKARVTSGEVHMQLTTSAKGVTPISHLQNMDNGSDVVLSGTVERIDGDRRFALRDLTGLVMIEVAEDALHNRELGENDRVAVVGVVDTSKNPHEVRVSSLVKDSEEVKLASIGSEYLTAIDRAGSVDLTTGIGMNRMGSSDMMPGGGMYRTGSYDMTPGVRPNSVSSHDMTWTERVGETIESGVAGITATGAAIGDRIFERDTRSPAAVEDMDRREGERMGEPTMRQRVDERIAEHEVRTQEARENRQERREAEREVREENRDNREAAREAEREAREANRENRAELREERREAERDTSPGIFERIGERWEEKKEEWSVNREINQETRDQKAVVNERVGQRQETLDEQYDAAKRSIEERYEAAKKNLDQSYDAAMHNIDTRYDAAKRQLEVRDEAAKDQLDERNRQMKEQAEEQIRNNPRGTNADNRTSFVPMDVDRDIDGRIRPASTADGIAYSTIALLETEEVKDDDHVVLKEYIRNRLDNDTYMLVDNTGEVKVEIDSGVWNNRTMNPDQLVEVRGKVDIENVDGLKEYKVDVDRITNL